METNAESAEEDEEVREEKVNWLFISNHCLSQIRCQLAFDNAPSQFLMFNFDEFGINR